MHFTTNFRERLTEEICFSVFCFEYKYRVRIGILTLFVPFLTSFRLVPFNSVPRSVPEHILPSLDLSFRHWKYRSVPGHIVPSLDILLRPWQTFECKKNCIMHLMQMHDADARYQFYCIVDADARYQFYCIFDADA